MKRTRQDIHEPGLSPKDRLNRRIIDYGILALIVFSPLPIASVPAWSILGIQIAVLAMMAAYVIMDTKPRINPELSAMLKVPKYMFTGLFLFLCVQIVPLPDFLVKIVSPHAFAFREQFSFDVLNTRFMTLSLAPFHTLKESLELLSYVLLGFLILKTVTQPRQIRRIFYALVAMGFFEAFYGLFELSRENPRLLFYKKDINLNFVTGTFVNQNHLAGYLEMILPLALGLVIARINFFQMAGKKLRQKIVLLTEKGFAVNVVLTACIVVMALAIVLSRSRSGAFLVVFAFIILAELSVLYFGGSKYLKRGISRFLQITFVFITFFVLYAGIGATLARFTLDDVFHGGRSQYWSHVAAISGDFPLFGTGLGTFASVYPSYAQTETYGLLAHAHNDYLEYLSELGIVGALLLIGGILFLAIRSFGMWKRRQNPEIKGLALGGIVSLAVISVHSLTDFNLHIPANMLLFSVILSLTAVTSYYGIRKRED